MRRIGRSKGCRFAIGRDQGDCFSEASRSAASRLLSTTVRSRDRRVTPQTQRPRVAQSASLEAPQNMEFRNAATDGADPDAPSHCSVTGGDGTGLGANLDAAFDQSEARHERRSW